MVDHPIVLAISDATYLQVEQIARATDQAVETILQKRIEESFADPRSRLPPDEQTELEALKRLSDDTLWTIAREQMTQVRQQRMSLLMDHNSAGTITPVDYSELSQLVELGQRLILRKAVAAELLMDRGYQVTSADMSPLDI